MNAPIIYIPNFVPSPNAVFDVLWNRLDWVRREGVPRREYYCSTQNKPYTYGRGAGVRTYHPQKWDETIIALTLMAGARTECTFDVAFLNGYENQSDHLGWHADDSPEMDDNRPIAIISLGAEREIWFRPNSFSALERISRPVEKLKLENGSLCIMLPGMQETHQHRIPKAGFDCGSRISLTLRGYSETVS